MRADLNSRLSHVKQQLDRWKDLKASLPSAQERASQEGFRLRQIETNLEQIQAQIRSLESFSLSNLIEGLLGKKEQRLAQCHEELTAAEKQRNKVTESLLELDAEVREIEQQLVGLGDPQRALQELCEEKEREILETQCETADRLRQLLTELEAAKGQRRELQKCIQIGKHVIDRVHSMTGSVGRSKSKMLYGGPLGAVGNTVVNTVMRQGSNAMVDRMVEKLGEFAKTMQGLDLSDATELDLEIARLAAVLAGQAHDLAANAGGLKILCDTSAAMPLLEQISTAIGHLSSKLERIEPHLKELEAQRLDLVEQV